MIKWNNIVIGTCVFLRLPSTGPVLHFPLNIQIPKTRLKSYSNRGFCHAAPTLWNKLPLEIKSALTLKLFKSKLKTHMVSKTASNWLWVNLPGEHCRRRWTLLDTMAPCINFVYYIMFSDAEFQNVPFLGVSAIEIELAVLSQALACLLLFKCYFYTCFSSC